MLSHLFVLICDLLIQGGVGLTVAALASFAFSPSGTLPRVTVPPYSRSLDPLARLTRPSDSRAPVDHSRLSA